MDGLGGTPAFDELVGIMMIELDAEHAVAEWDVRAELLQPHGIVHGGVYCTVVETLASLPAAAWFGDRGTVVGVSNHTDFLRPIRSGRLRGSSSPIHRGRSQQLWMVEIHDESVRLVARGQVRLQNLAVS